MTASDTVQGKSEPKAELDINLYSLFVGVQQSEMRREPA